MLLHSEKATFDDDAGEKKYPMLLHSEKAEKEVAVRPTVVDVRLKSKSGHNILISDI